MNHGAPQIVDMRSDQQKAKDLKDAIVYFSERLEKCKDLLCQVESKSEGGMTDHARIGRNNRRKGASGERELCSLIAADLGIPTKRILGQEREGGHDIQLGPLKVEVKRRKRLSNVYEWLSAADVVAMRADGKQWVVAMSWELFVKLAREEVNDNHASGE